ncbi:hypothetical protein HY469_03180 [Candidatus Roizmanbacteria bacterium]|nr:hypothetical protein [Candidatus Roizmanbacteria bacterium]
MTVTHSPAKQFIIKISGGLIRTESQAMTFIVILFILSLVVSAVVLYQTFVPETDTEYLPSGMTDAPVPQ